MRDGIASRTMRPCQVATLARAGEREVLAMSRPKLLCLMHLPPPVHGVTLVNQRVAASAALAERLELDVLPLRFAGAVDELGRITATKLARAAATGLSLAARLAVRRPDAMYLTMSPHGGALLRDCAYAALARLAGVPRIYHLHARGIGDALATGWRRRLGAWVFDGAWVIHLGPQLAHDTAELADPARVLAVENGVPDDNPSGALAGSGRAVPRVVFLSNMIADKGPLVLVAALAALARRGVALDATFAGAEGDGRTLGEFRAAIERHNLADRVRYVGPVFDAAKHELLAAHDVFALPTARDAFPLVLLEAMQHGLPVVTTTVGAIADIVVEGETGFLVPPGDVATLADRLGRLAADPALRRRLGAAGRARYADRFTFEAFERRLTDALTQIIQGGGQRDRAVRGPASGGSERSG
jgi:glycosyltransferase involved in cell wall biosynthesis